MAYTPINWQTGDVITAEKLNKMDNGWGVQRTQLFSETVTTTLDEGYYYSTLTYSQLIDADSIIVIYDGTEYECQPINTGEYGAPWSDELNSYDYSTYPFNLYTESNLEANLATETAGEHTIAVVAPSLQTSAGFAEAVLATIGGAFYPLVIGTTTWAQVVDALAAGKLVFRSWADAYDDGTTGGTQYAGIELVTDAYADSHGEYAVSAIVTEKGVQSVTSYRASSVNGALNVS